MYVNIYLVNRQYGGPEEGGWWYDVGQAIETWTVRKGRRRARRLRRMLRKAQRKCRARNRGRKPLHSVLCEGIFEAYQENMPASDFPKHRPHFE